MQTETQTLTLETICQDFSLWQEHIEIDGLDTKEAFESMTFDERLDIAETLYWYECENGFGNFEAEYNR
jgi:hypothetical protein